jgi:hypothetical protein
MSYRTKVRVVEAFRWLGQSEAEWPKWATPELLAQSGSALYAYTGLGPIRVHKGNWCVLADREIYPLADEVFRNRYEEMPAPAQSVGVANVVG